VVVVQELGMGPEKVVKVYVCAVECGRRHVLQSSNLGKEILYGEKVCVC